MPVDVRTLAFPLAVLIVVLTPLAVIGLASSAEQWVRWLLRAGGAVGMAGVVLTAVATVNLLVPRTCATEPVEEVNRPLISLVLGSGDCFRSALAQAQVAALVGVTASVAAVTRSERVGGGAGPAVRSP